MARLLRTAITITLGQLKPWHVYCLWRTTS